MLVSQSESVPTSYVGVDDVHQRGLFSKFILQTLAIPWKIPLCLHNSPCEAVGSLIFPAWLFHIHPEKLWSESSLAGQSRTGPISDLRGERGGNIWPIGSALQLWMKKYCFEYDKQNGLFFKMDVWRRKKQIRETFHLARQLKHAAKLNSIKHSYVFCQQHLIFKYSYTSFRAQLIRFKQIPSPSSWWNGEKRKRGEGGEEQRRSCMMG